MSELWPGRPFPLGAVWDGDGTNFAVFSEHAEGVELCLFDGDDHETRITMRERTAFHWHCYLPGVGPGQRYAYRVSRALRPERRPPVQPPQAAHRPVRQGHRRPGRVRRRQRAALRARRRRRRPRRRRRGRPGRHPEVGRRVDEHFDWEGDRLPRTPWNETIIYETHVKGFTQCHPHVREDLRGTYAGLASEEAIAHFVELGVTAIELLPVHHIADEAALVDKGLSNYWGYSSIGYLAPHSEYAATGRRGQQLAEFKGMVKALHARRDRGHPRRRLQPHRRGQPPGSDALVPRHRQRVVLPVVDRRPALLRRLHRHRQQPQPGAARTCCGSSWTRCATSWSSATSTGSASTSRRRWRASSTR